MLADFNQIEKCFKKSVKKRRSGIDFRSKKVQNCLHCLVRKL